MAQVLTINDYQTALESAVKTMVMTPHEASYRMDARIGRQWKEGKISFQSAVEESKYCRQRFFEAAVGYI